MGKQRDYYLTLKISPDATIDEIKASFRRLARQYHPDLNPDDPKAAEEFKAISQAYDILSDPLKRRRYDRDRKLTDSSYSVRNKTSEPIKKSHNAQYYYRRGMAQSNNKQYQNAITEYSRAIALDDKFVDAYLQRSQMRHKLGDYQGVLDDCYRIISINPKVVKAYYYQGRARYSLGYVQAAIDSYSEAIRQDQDYAQAYYYRGIAYGDLRERTAAVHDLLMAAELFRLEGNYEAYYVANNKIKNLDRLSLRIFRNIKYFFRESIIFKFSFPIFVLSALLFFLTQIFNIQPLFVLLLFSLFLLLFVLVLWSKLYKL